MKALVIGYGSIGSRHARLLNELGCNVAVVSQQKIKDFPQYLDVKSGIFAERPQYVVIANKTIDHYGSLVELEELEFEGVILVEKPLFHEELEYNNERNQIFIAYNLRFHPMIKKIATILKSENVISVQAYVGQYLPTWRPQRDYRLNYSAIKAEGGGVLRDLSHELDYLNWILGGWNRLTSLGGQFSNLEIDSDDVYAVMMNTKKCPVVTLHMNYLDKIKQREILINTDSSTIKADLIKNTLMIDGVSEYFEFDADTTYRLQHQAALRQDFSSLCSLDEGKEALHIINAIEEAALKETWIFND